MSAAEISMILDRGLTTDEKSKFDRVQDRFSAIFTAAGRLVRVCDGTGEGDNRMIEFRPGFVGRPLVSITAAQFLAASEAELVRELQLRF